MKRPFIIPPHGAFGNPINLTVVFDLEKYEKTDKNLPYRIKFYSVSSYCFWAFETKEQRDITYQNIIMSYANQV